MTERIIGIDFGTSTSLVKVKRYKDGRPIGDNIHTDCVTYGDGDGDSKAVTLVRINPDGTADCGREGSYPIDGATVYREFKMDLQSPDEQKRKQARELTSVFMDYLYTRYDHQRETFGDHSDVEKTIISYPVKWPSESRKMMEQIAAEAGFPNVSSMDEPTAALYAVLCQNMEGSKSLLRFGKPGYILLVDMGAGTTDLAVCRYEIQAAPGAAVTAETISNQVLGTWPKASSSVTFGGREVDRKLEQYLLDHLTDCGLTEAYAAAIGLPANFAKAVVCDGNSVKAWKEDTVSPTLKNGRTVSTCAFMGIPKNVAPIKKPFPAFDRASFETIIADGLRDFKHLVTESLTEAAAQFPELGEQKLDLVILTGGHSSWYFSAELLDGTMEGLGHPLLEKVQTEKQRVMRLPCPQETVSLGMVYSRLQFKVTENREVSREKEKKIEKKEANPSEAKGPSPAPAARIDYAARVKRFVENSDALKRKDLSRNADTAKIRKFLDIPSWAAVYFCSDATLFHTNKYGMALTSAGYYFRLNFESPHFIKWENFAQCNLSKPKDNTVNVCVEDLTVSIADFTGCINIGYDFLAALQAELRRPESVQLTVQDAVQRFISEYDPDWISAVFSQTYVPRMRSRFGIPADEQIYLAHDDTILGSGKNGVMIGSCGFYTRTLFSGTTVFVPWEQFVAGELEGGGEIICSTAMGHRCCGYINGYGDSVMEFYKKLQRELRGQTKLQQELRRQHAKNTV